MVLIARIFLSVSALNLTRGRYHGHYSSQYASGLSGPIVVHGPKNVEYDVDLGPVQVNDW